MTLKTKLPFKTYFKNKDKMTLQDLLEVSLDPSRLISKNQDPLMVPPSRPLPVFLSTGSSFLRSRATSAATLVCGCLRNMLSRAKLLGYRTSMLLHHVCVCVSCRLYVRMRVYVFLLCVCVVELFFFSGNVFLFSTRTKKMNYLTCVCLFVMFVSLFGEHMIIR